MSTEDVDYSETDLTPMEFTAKKCKTVKDIVKHQKMFPECRNVTKQNCETLWETDAEGNQVWAGKENCQPVTWQECKLVPKYVDFIIPKVECEDLEQLWYHEPQPVDKVKTTNVLTCVVKSTTDCHEKKGHSCKNINWQECKEVPMTDCKPSHVHKPAQEQVHKKKCLLPDEPPVPAYGAPAPVPQARSYPTLPPAVPSYGGRQGRSRGGRLL